MSPMFEPETIRLALDTDAEFAIAARYWTTQFRIEVQGTQSLLIKITDGRVVEVDAGVTPFDRWSFQLSGTVDHWRALLAPEPAPFYQDYYAAMLYHGFRIEGDMEQIMAYYPAVRRSLEVLRDVTNQNSNKVGA